MPWRIGATIVVALVSSGQSVPHLAGVKAVAPQHRFLLAALPRRQASFKATVRIVGWAIACVAVWGAIILT